MPSSIRPWRAVKVLAGILAAALLATGCGGAATGAKADSGCTQMKGTAISFFDQSDASTEIENAIAMYIASNGYCYPTKSLILGSDVGNQSLVDGQLDVNTELWRMNFIDWYNKNTKNGKILDLGNMYEKSSQSFFIPYYTAQQYPNLKSVSQLAQYWKDFKDPLHPSQGFFINCMIQWHCSVSNQVMLKAAGVYNDFYIETPGTSGAEKAEIMGAYKKHENFVAYWWTPDALLSQIKLVELKQPAYTSQCNTLQDSIWSATNNGASLSQELQKVTPAYDCGYQTYGIHKGVNAAFAKKAPDFIAFFKKMDIGDGPLEAAEVYYGNHDNDAQKTALWFFGKYQQEWESWLPASILQRVKASLIKDGVNLS